MKIAEWFPLLTHCLYIGVVVNREHHEDKAVIYDDGILLFSIVVKCYPEMPPLFGHDKWTLNIV